MSKYTSLEISKKIDNTFSSICALKVEFDTIINDTIEIQDKILAERILTVVSNIEGWARQFSIPSFQYEKLQSIKYIK